MANWWEDPDEQFWCEITDRNDIGADLKCPQTKENGQVEYSYNLIKGVSAGDVVFHYYTPDRAFVGASVAGAPLEQREIVWTPHGTVGRSKKTASKPRPGWWLPVYHFTRAMPHFRLEELQGPKEQQFIRAWLKSHKYGPFQPYPKRLRAAQAYLTKMPLAFVQRWSDLSVLAEKLEEVRENLSPLFYTNPKILGANGSKAIGFKAKSHEDYSAFVRGGVQIRTRKHESLVAKTAKWLEQKNATVSNPHPIDLLVTEPIKLIIEAKTVGVDDPLFAVREAVGQLHEYRYFCGPREAKLCILLDASPNSALVKYVEQELGLFILWQQGNALHSGPETRSLLSNILPL